MRGEFPAVRRKPEGTGHWIRGRRGEGFLAAGLQKEGRREASLLAGDEAEQSQRSLEVASAGAECWRDVDCSGQTQQADGQIAQRGHDLSSGMFANAAAVFVKAHVAHIMQAVFNAPVAAVQGQQARRVGFFRIQAGDAIHGFCAELARGQFRGLALEAEDLSDVGEIKIALELGAGPDAPDFQAAVAFIEGGVLRGEMLPSEDPRYLV